MKCELAADEIKTSITERERCSVSPDPGDGGSLRSCLTQHALRSVQSDQPIERDDRAVCHQLISCPASDVQDGKPGTTCSLAHKGQQLGVGRFRSMRLCIIQVRNRVVVCPARFHEAPRCTSFTLSLALA